MVTELLVNRKLEKSNQLAHQHISISAHNAYSSILYALLSFTLILSGSNITFAQKNKLPSGKDKGCPEVVSKKAVKFFEEGTDKGNDKKKRVEALKKAILLQPDYVEANYVLAEEIIKTAKADGGSFKPAEAYLEKVVEHCPDYYAYTYYWLGMISQGNGQYEKAHNYFEKFLTYPDDAKSDKDYLEVQELSKLTKKLSEIYDNPRPFDPHVVDGVSSKEDEYLAIISPDNEIMLYTRKIGYKEQFRDGAAEPDDAMKYKEIFSFSNRKEASFDGGQAFAPPFNKGDNYGGASMTTDNRRMYITVCKPAKIQRNGKYYDYTNCDIYETVLENGSWSELKNLGPNVNTEDGWEAQPSISSDGRVLYFATYRTTPDTLGGLDLYRCLKQADGEWGKAENLGPTINTNKSEKSPFVHSDSETLYFSSDGHLGAGGYDIFYAKGDATGNWKKPKNIGIPINTTEDEVGFFVSIDGKLGYFSSKAVSGKGKGGYDIFSFDLYPEARPETVVLMKGNLTDESGKVPENAKIEIKNSVTNEITEVPVDKSDGQYVAIVKVKKEEDLVMTVKQEGAAFTSQLVKTKGSDPRVPKKVDMEVKKVEVGKPYKINNINFATNSAELTEDSKYVLNEFAEYLKAHPGMSIAIHGHTDNIGKDSDNLALSTDRAFSVMGYLQDKGVAGMLMQFKGFGPTKPVVPNDSEENRAKNRRTEFVVLTN